MAGAGTGAGAEFQRAAGVGECEQAGRQTPWSSRRSVLVVGANGQTGSRVVRLLQQSAGEFEPVAMIREESQRDKFDNLGVRWVVGDIEAGASPFEQCMAGVDAVIFAAGAGRARGLLRQVKVDYAGALRAIVAAQESPTVGRFILLSGINSDVNGTRRSVNSTDLDGPLAPWHRLKANSEHHLRESHRFGRQLNWTILCPGRLLDPEGTAGGSLQPPNEDRRGLVTASLIHFEDDLKQTLTAPQRAAAVQRVPGSHDGRQERLCCSRDNVAAALVGLLAADNTIGKSITLVDGLVPVRDALAAL